MAFVEYQHDVLLCQYLAQAFVLVVDVGLHQVRQLLYRRDDDVHRRVFQLFQQHAGRRVRVGAVGFKVVILLHRLVVQVLAVHHKQHLRHLLHLRGQLRRLERGQRLARACGVPDVAAGLDGPLPVVVDGRLYAQQYLLRCSYLVGAHHQQLLVDVEHAVLRQDVQDGVLRKECRREVADVRQQRVLLVCPVRCKLKRVAVGLVLAWAAVGLLLLGEACGVRVVFRFCAVRDDEYLHVVEHSAACPERVPQVAVYLVEGLLDGHAPALQFDMHQRQTVHQYRHVVAVLMGTVGHLILVDYLQAVVVDVGLVDELDVLRRAIIQPQVQHVALALNHLRLVGDGHLFVANHGQQAAPLAIREHHVVQQLQLAAKVLQQPGLVLHLHVLVALTLKLLDERLLQRRLTLIALSRLRLHLVVRRHRLVLLLYYDFIVVHRQLFFVFICRFGKYA